MFFAASGRPVRDTLHLFAQEVAASNLPGAELVSGIELAGWDAALRLLATALPDDGSVVVLDEIPYLVASDESVEGTLQRAFDRKLARKRVAVIGTGSDLGMMEALNEYGRPFHQRAKEVVVPAKRVLALGSIRWLENAPFDRHDLGELHAHRTRLPGAAVDTPLIAVARSGCSVDGVEHFGPDELIAHD